MRKRYKRKPGNANREKVTAGQYLIGDTIAGRKITGFGKTWREGSEQVQYAYFTEQKDRTIVTTFSSGESVYRNSRGRCEDAPCCGCCS